MQDLLGYRLNTLFMKYNKDGFLVGNELVCSEGSFDDGGISSFSYELLEEKDDYYKYFVIIQEEGPYNHNVAFGTVVYDLPKGTILVDGKEGGCLYDKYEDGFDLNISCFGHLLKR